MNSVVIFCVGLFLGWNVLPQPAWVKNLYAQVRVIIKTALQDAARNRNEESR